MNLSAAVLMNAAFLHMPCVRSAAVRKGEGQTRYFAAAENAAAPC